MMSDGVGMEDFENILSWYILSGVDDICGDEPVNFLQSGKDIKASSEQKSPVSNEKDYNQSSLRPATTLLAQTNVAACADAREICKKAQTLEDLKAMVESFEGCALKFSANSTVFGYGNPRAEVMIIGEAPGADEDRRGEPFVGRSGRLLDKMLQAIAIQREDCFITNILPWRPPGNRTPTEGEVAVCLPFLHRQIELIKPRVLLLLGGSAANAVLGNADSISNMRGHFMDYETEAGEKFLALASFHPAFLLRSPAQKAKAWADLMRLQRKLRE